MRFDNHSCAPSSPARPKDVLGLRYFFADGVEEHGPHASQYVLRTRYLAAHDFLGGSWPGNEGGA
eukprot:11232060-Prorocentrum_lima.AAC.1